RRAHGSRHRQEHLSAARQMRDVGFRSVHHNRRVEMPVLVLDEIFYAHADLSLRIIFTENILAQILCYTRPCFKRRTSILKNIFPEVNCECETSADVSGNAARKNKISKSHS